MFHILIWGLTLYKRRLLAVEDVEVFKLFKGVEWGFRWSRMVEYYQQPPPNSYSYQQQPGYDYTQQEEEWDREGLLDPAWEKQQKKVSHWTIIHIKLRSSSSRSIYGTLIQPFMYQLWIDGW